MATAGLSPGGGASGDYANNNGKMAYSTDGVSWTAVANNTFDTSNSDIYKIAYGNNRFVAVGTKGKIAYSSDGVSWTAVTVPFTIGPIAYGNGKFVAGGLGKIAYADW